MADVVETCAGRADRSTGPSAAQIADAPPGSRVPAESPVDVGEADLDLVSVAPGPWCHHAFILALAVLVICMAFALEVRGSGRVAVRGVPGFVLPHTCATRILFDTPCPGCGLTRSFIHLAAGRWQAAFGVHRLGWLLACLVVAQVPYRVVRLIDRRVGPPGWTVVVSWIMIGLLLLNWGLLQAGF